MSEMSLEQQISCMQEMRSELGDFCKMMRGYMDAFQDDIQFLRSQGLSTETEERYQKGYYTPANEEVDRVISDIQRQHFDYIDRVIERLQRALHEQ